MILEIVAALIAEIKLSLSTVRTVEGYSGQLEAEADQLPFLDPAVFVVYSGSTPTRVDNRMFFESAKFLALACCRNLQGRTAAEGDAVTLARQLVELLTNAKLGLDIEPLTPTLVELVFISGDLCVYGVHFETTYSYVPTNAPA